MNRLTFHNVDGSFGVIGMNETNETEKVMACIGKLVAYEDIGKEPNECVSPDLCVGTLLPSGYTVDANFCNLYILASRNVVAWNPGDPLKEYVIWHLDANREMYFGKYCTNAEEAQRHFAWLCFDWFTDKDRPEPKLNWKSYGTHKVTRYKGWLLLIDCMRDAEDTICLLLPDEDWDDADLLCEYEDVTSYEPEWEVCSEREAVDYIDNYEANKACKKRGGTCEDAAMAMETVRGNVQHESQSDPAPAEEWKGAMLRTFLGDC